MWPSVHGDGRPHVVLRAARISFWNLAVGRFEVSPGRRLSGTRFRDGAIAGRKSLQLVLVAQLLSVLSVIDGTPR